MGIGDIIGFVSVGIGMIIAYPALLILLNILFSKSTTRIAYRLEKGMKLSFFVGLFILVVGGFAVVTLLSAGSVLQFIGFVLYLLLSFWGTVGNAALARLFGIRLSELGKKEPSTLYELLSGGFVLTLSFAFPLVGWLVIMPIITCIALGAMTINLFSRAPRISETLEEVAAS